MTTLGTSRLLLIISAILIYCSLETSFSQKAKTKEPARWTESFDLDKCRFSSTGENKYFILKPGFRLEFEGVEGKDTTRLIITVLNETRHIGNVETRVVEERETTNGVINEISRNFFAVCTQTNSVCYFGEEVDIYKNGTLASHGGAWRADSGGAKAGVMMPGLVLLGSRFYQEMAPGVAMDRAEIISGDETMHLPAGDFYDCLKIEETSPLEPKAKEYKIYAPGIGLVKDGDLRLIKYGI